MNKVCSNQDMVSVLKGSLFLRRASIWRVFVAVIAVMGLFAMVSVAHADPPVADFSATPTYGVQPLVVTFTDESTGTIDTWAWDFDNDTVIDSTEQNPSFTYDTPGTYTVTLTASGLEGSDSETKTDYITVGDSAVPPLADFSASPTTGGVPISVQFTDLSTGGITEYYWEFGDGQTGTERHPVHEYQAGGDYTVKLTVTGPAGCDLRGKVEYIHVTEAPPAADFSAAPTSGMAPLSVTFTDQSTGTIHTWAWDFDNDGATDSTEQHPSYIYDTPGTYTVTLTVTNSGGGDLREKINYIHVSAGPIADFSANPRSGMAPLSVTFTDESTGTIDSWEWDFDNDTVIDSTEQNPSNIYNTPGTYTVTLTVTGPEGSNLKERTDYIHVSATALTADFTGSPTSGVAPLAVTFTDLSTGTIDTWSWDFDNDGTTDSTEQNPSYTYNTLGAYTVTLTITDPGNSDVREKTDYIHVSEAPPLADFSASPTSGTVPLGVQFTDLSTGDITDYYWEFGDGETSTDQNPLHEYQAGGDYTVKLTVTGAGGSDVRGKIDYVYVGDPPPVCDFTANPTSGDAPLSVQFTDLSTGAITEYYWEFGDGWNSSEQNPLHEYQSGGDYTVTLTVTGPGGSEFRGKVDYIHVDDLPPVANFSGFPTSGVRPLTVQFTDESTGIITDYYWQFGDGHPSLEQSPLHDYDFAGDYTVTLTVTGPGGSDVRSKIGYIHVDEAPPTADFMASPRIVPRDWPVQFTDTSEGVIDIWEWDFDNNGTTDSTEQNPSFSYDTPGTYTVTLRVTGPGGSDQMEKTDYVEVTPWPIADFSGTPTSGTRPVVVQFTNRSMGAIDTWEWDFDNDGTVDSTEQNPVHVYPSIGDYTVTLTVTGPNGSNTREQTDYIHVGEEEFWAKTYGVTGSMNNDRAQCIEPTADGGYIVAGRAARGYDFWVLKLNADGTVRWQNLYDGGWEDNARSIQETADGGYIVMGETYSFGDGWHSDIWVLKLNADGTTAWQKAYGGSGSETAYAIQETADGGYIVAGCRDMGFYRDVWVLKLDSNGAVAWQKIYSESGWDVAYAVQETTDGGYIVAGESSYDVWVLKLNPDGTVAWQKAYGGSGSDAAYDVQQTADGGYIVAGESSYDVWVLKLNPDGTVAWQKTYAGDGTGSDAARSVRQTADSGYIVAGHTYSFYFVPGSYDMWLLKLDSNGAVTWQNTYGGAPWDEKARAVRQTVDGGYVVAGWTGSFGDGNQYFNDFWVLRLDVNGEIPGCNAIGSSLPTVTETTIVEADTNGAILETGVTPFITNIPPIQTSFETSVVCTVLVESQADFTADTTTGTKPLFVQFTNLSTGSFTDWEWDFGDGGTSPDQNPSHTYAQVGSFTVSLTATGPEGSDTEIKTDYIQVVKSVDFIGAPTSGPSPLTVYFVNNSIGDFTAWFWDFGDGQTSTEENPWHVYWDIGSYTVSLTATGAHGEETETKTDYICAGIPEPGVPVIENLVPRRCEPGTKIVIKGGNFGDAQGDSVVHIGYKTFDSSSPRIKLWTDNKIKIKIPNYKCKWFKGEDYRRKWVWVTVGGEDSNKVRLKVLKPDPCAAFSATPTSGDEPLEVTFTDESSSTGSIDTWSWDFDNDTVIDSTEQNPSYTYETVGAYAVTLTVSGSQGSDSRTKWNYITVTEPGP